MNTLVLLVAASCAPAADPMPVMQSTPYVPRSVSAASQEFSGAPQESRPRFFARMRGLFSRKSRTVEGASPEFAGYPQGMPANGAISPALIASPGISMEAPSAPIFQSQPSFAPASSSTPQRMPTGQPF